MPKIPPAHQHAACQGKESPERARPPAQAARESLALAPPTEKLTCMLLQAEARTGMGNSHLLLWQVRSQIGLLFSREPAELDQTCLLGVQVKTDLAESLPKFCQELLGVLSMLVWCHDFLYQADS
jgi:hypothetical protein